MPGLSVSVDGFDVTPAGKPLRFTLTLPVNPYSAFAVTATISPVAPAIRLSVTGEAVRVKSGGDDTGLDAWLPQPMMATGRAAARITSSDAGILRMKHLSNRLLPFAPLS